MDRLILEDMIWPEVAEVLPEIKVALIPVGSCEQHGPNTTFVTDTVRAYRIAKLLAGRCGQPKSWQSDRVLRDRAQKWCWVHGVHRNLPG